MNQWWQRDPTPGDWISDDADTEKAIAFLAKVPSQHALVVGPLTEDDWAVGVSKRSNASSRGKCGFSPWELKSMPVVFIRLFLLILNAIEDGLAWPS